MLLIILENYYIINAYLLEGVNMISRNNLYKLYDYFINNQDISTKSLYGLDFTNYDISIMLKDGLIERIKKGVYVFKNVNELIEYGELLLSYGEYEDAYLCFKRCLELGQNNNRIYLNLFLLSLKNGEYDKSLEYYKILSKTYEDKNDLAYYLYLLSYVVDLDLDDINLVKNIKTQDVLIPDSDNSEVSSYNDVRIESLDGRFAQALKSLSEISYRSSLTIDGNITKILLKRVMKAKKKSNDKVIRYIKEEDYNGLVNHLDDRREKHVMSVAEEYTYKLAKVIVEGTDKTINYQKGNTEVNDIFSAIDTHNYEEALRYALEYEKKIAIKRSNPITLLLQKICDLNKKDDIFLNIIDALKDEKLDSAFSFIKKYLSDIEKSEYEFLIFDLIKLSALNKDFSYSRVMSELTLLNKASYVPDLRFYLERFYNALYTRDFKSCEVLLDITNKLSSFDVNNSDIVNDIESRNRILAYYKDSNSHMVSNNIDDVHDDEVLHEDKTELRQNNIIDSKNNESDYKIDYLFIKSKKEILDYDKGALLLKPLSEERQKRLLKIIKEFPDISAFTIDIDGKPRLVLKYSHYFEEWIDIKQIVHDARQAYKSGDYGHCIHLNLYLLQFYKTPRTNIYQMIGLSYLRLQNKKKAKMYLTIANALAKQEKDGKDFGDILLSISGDLEPDEMKPIFKMKSEDYEIDFNVSNYGVNNFDEINNYICSTGMDVESACIELGMDFEKIDIIKLLYAREYYKRGNIYKGDQFIKAVEARDNKSSDVLNMLNEVRSKKVLYKHKNCDNDMQLSLSLYPNKK